MTTARPEIELRQLRYFLTLFEELHYGRAAERLGMAQPPLSRAIAKLEARLEVELFDRTSRGVAATEAAELLAPAAAKILASVDDAVAEVRRAGGAQGSVRIGCPPHFPVAWSKLFLDALAERHPGPVPAVEHMLSVEQKRRLRHGDLDLGLVYYTGQEAGIRTATLFPAEEIVAFMRADHPLAGRSDVRPEDVADQTLLMLPRAVQPRLHDALLAQLVPSGHHFGRVREAGGADPRDLLATVMESSGLTMSPPWFGQDHLSDGVLVARPFSPPVLGPEVVLAWRAKVPASLAGLVAHAQEAAQDVSARIQQAG